MERTPFSEELHPFERSGALKDIFEATKGSNKFIIKKYAHPKEDGKRLIDFGYFKYEIETPKWLGDEPAVGTYQFSINRKKDYELMKRYLGDHMPNTLFVFGEDEEAKPSNFEVQEKIEGKCLGRLSDEEIEKRPEIISQIREIAQKSLDMFNEIGWLPDIHEDILHTDNIICSNDGKLSLVDTDSIFKIPEDLFFKYRNNLSLEPGELNPELLDELKEMGMEERYMGDIKGTYNSIYIAANG